MGSRGLKNRNPGNIRRSKTHYRGEIVSTDRSFKQFGAMTWGYRAVFVLLHTYGKRYGITTIAQMISRWAPPSENDTENYIRAVSLHTGIGRDEPLDTLDGRMMIPLAEAISKVENGIPATHSDVEDGWRLFVADFGH